jgi:hypothetical protein
MLRGGETRAAHMKEPGDPPWPDTDRQGCKHQTGWLHIEVDLRCWLSSKLCSSQATMADMELHAAPPTTYLLRVRTGLCEINALELASSRPVQRWS